MNRPIAIAIAGVILAVLGLGAYSLGVMAGRQPELHGTALQEPPDVSDVALVASGNEGVRLGDFAGEHLLVFFGYSNCPDVCPLTMARLGTIFRSLGEPEGLEVVMITVDPENDTPEVIDSYAKRFHERFTGLGGPQEVVDAAAGRFFIAHGSDGAGELIHGSQVLLVDPAGRFTRVYNDEAQLYLESDLRALLAS